MSLEEMMAKRTLRYRWEKAKLVVVEWWLRLLRRPYAIEEDEE